MIKKFMTFNFKSDLFVNKEKTYKIVYLENIDFLKM